MLIIFASYIFRFIDTIIVIILRLSAITLFFILRRLMLFRLRTYAISRPLLFFEISPLAAAAPPHAA